MHLADGLLLWFDLRLFVGGSTDGSKGAMDKGTGKGTGGSAKENPKSAVIALTLQEKVSGRYFCVVVVVLAYPAPLCRIRCRSILDSVLVLAARASQ